MYPTIAINGQIIGTWKRIFKKYEVIMELNPFSAINGTENHFLDAAANHFGEFLEMPVCAVIVS